MGILSSSSLSKRFIIDNNPILSAVSLGTADEASVIEKRWEIDLLYRTVSINVYTN